MPEERPHGFRSLRVWQEAVRLAADSFAIADALPAGHAALADQIRRAAGSVHANIAEGASRPSRRDFVRLLVIARGSFSELEAHVALVEHTALVPPRLTGAFDTRASHVGQLLPALIRSQRDPPT